MTERYIKYSDLLKSSIDPCQGIPSCEECPLETKDGNCRLELWLLSIPKYEKVEDMLNA